VWKILVSTFANRSRGEYSKKERSMLLAAAKMMENTLELDEAVREARIAAEKVIRLEKQDAKKAKRTKVKPKPPLVALPLP
jgi:hypothetical protein